jgi:polyphosphate kinase
VKITRDAEMDVESEFGESLVDKVSKGIKSRRFGDPLRFVYDEEMPSDLRNYILKQMEFKKTDAIIAGGRYHNFKDFIGFPSLGRQDLVYKPNIALSNLSIKQSKSVLQAVKQSDLFLHYPYFGFSQFVQLLRESAIDSEVLGIHITLYRMAKNSKVARALIYAAKNGKQVTAVVELRARFDEEHNIYWATKMQEAGVNVIFGVEGLKIHSKMTLIRMKKNKGIAAISTGNFHEGNASVYTDFTLFTADNNIVSEVARVFDFIDHPFQNLRFSHLLVSPQEMRKKIYGLITTEINNAKKKLPAFIKCKINHITDQYVIMKLYEAAKAGVKVQLIIRGMTSIIPNQKELKGNLEIVSVVDRYLEHSRIFVFCNNNNPKYYISSADWMRRNLDGRIEVAVPIYDKRIQNELDIILDYGLRDNVKARIVDEHGDNEFKTNDLPSFRSQSELYDYYVRQQEQG